MWQVLDVGAAYWLHFLFLYPASAFIAVRGRWFERAACAAWFLPQRYMPWCRVAECGALTPWLWIGADAVLSAALVWGAGRTRRPATGFAAAVAVASTVMDLIAADHPGLAPWAYGSFVNPCFYLIGAALLLSVASAARASPPQMVQG